MFLGFIGKLAELFNRHGVKATYTGGSVGIQATPFVDQTYKGKIEKHPKLPQKVSYAEVQSMAKQAAEAKENAKNLKEYRQKLEEYITACKASYGETAKYQVFYQKAIAEIAKIDAITNQSIGQSLQVGNVARATLSGYEAACAGAAEYRP